MTESWRIERIVPGGDGMARLGDGRIGFASGALPGDEIRPERLEQHKSWARAATWELLRPGPGRVKPACPVAERCGGCDLMQLARNAELEVKASIVREALTRTGGFRGVPPKINIVTGSAHLGYRGRIRLHVDRDGNLGLYERGSHRLVVIPGCPVCVPEIEQALREIRALAQAHPGALAQFSELEIRAAPAGPRLSLHLTRRETPETAASRALLAALGERYTVLADGGAGAPDLDQRWPLPGGVELHAPPGGFTQVNWEVNTLLVSAVIDGAKARSVARFCDLYCGSGNFTLPLLAAQISGIGIERAGASIRAARRAARARNLSDDAFIAADVVSELSRLASRGERFDLVVLDPPRAGAKEALKPLVQLAPRAIALCACDPVTLARDAKTLAAAGYRLEEVTAFDMFPHTHHVETLAWLARR